MNIFFDNSKTVTILLGTLGLIVTFEGLVFAQLASSKRGIGPARRIERVRQRNDQEARANVVRDVSDVRSAANARRREVVLSQIRHDFKSLQDSYNRIVRAMEARDGFSPHSVLEDVTEIRKCSTRLRTNLVLPKSEDEQQKITDNGSPEQSLLKLRKHIYDFVINPVFDNPVAYKVDEAKKASADLDQIITVSQSIEKTAFHAKKVN